MKDNSLPSLESKHFVLVHPQSIQIRNWSLFSITQVKLSHFQDSLLFMAFYIPVSSCLFSAPWTFQPVLSCLTSGLIRVRLSLYLWTCLMKVPFLLLTCSLVLNINILNVDRFYSYSPNCILFTHVSPRHIMKILKCKQIGMCINVASTQHTFYI